MLALAVEVAICRVLGESESARYFILRPLRDAL